jgi:hypothetical protein
MWLREFWKSIRNLARRKERQRDGITEIPGEPERQKTEAGYTVDHPELTRERPDSLPTAAEAGEPRLVIRKKSREVKIQVGLDFGTSSTKIMYTQLDKRLCRVMNLGHNLRGYPSYCLPSVAAIDERGSLLLGIEAARFLSDKPWDAGFQRFKMIVAGNCDPTYIDEKTCMAFDDYRASTGAGSMVTAKRLTAIYLAYVMNLVRSHLERRPEYLGLHLDVAFNICMPIDHVENASISKTFQDILHQSECMERMWPALAADGSSLLAFAETSSMGDEPTKVFLVPESVAGMASYLISLKKKEGLHAVVDIGAGTTDLSIFNLAMPSGNVTSSWYAARSISQGTTNIERQVVSHMRQTQGKVSCTIGDILTSLEGLEHGKTTKRGRQKGGGELDELVLRELTSLRELPAYGKTWASAYKHLHAKSSWEKVEVVVCGGGARLPHVSEVFSVPWWGNLEARYPVTRLPVADDYDDDGTGAPFDRMAVAYGLARPLPTLDHFTLPGSSGDDTPPRLPSVSRDHEWIYAK